MLEFVKLFNFESHRKTIIYFHPRVNVIIGDNDVGKTSILRAIEWVATNPSGEEYISTWLKRGEVTKVIIGVDGHIIARIRGKSKNQYQLDGKVYKAVGKNKVPKDIASILNLDALNFQFQFDGPFLLSNNPSEVARYLNKMVALDVIDNSLSWIEKDKRQIERQLKFEKEQRVRFRKEKKETDWLPKAEEQIIIMDGINTQVRSDEYSLKTLYELVHDIKEEEKNIEKLKPLLKLGNKIVMAEKLIKKTEAFERTIEKLQELVNDIKDTEREIKDAKRKADEYDKQFHKLMPNICPLCGRRRANENSR